MVDQLQQLGGGERVLLNMARMLPSRGYPCSIVTLRDGVKAGVAESISCPLHVLPLRRAYDANAVRQAMRLRRIIRSEGVRIIHTFFETSDIWGGVAGSLAGCPVLISSRRDVGILRTAKHRVAYRLINPLFDQVQTVSNEVRSAMIAQDALPESKVLTIYNGVELPKAPDSDSRSWVRAAFDIPADHAVIATVGNIRRVKGIDVLVAAAARVCQLVPSCTFVIVGTVLESEFFNELSARVSAHGIADRVKFIGGSNEVARILYGSDLFCLPSRSEGLSNALLEGMAASLACVATAVGGNPEVIVEGETGYLVPSEDDAAMAQRLTELLVSPQKARAMGQAGRKRVDQLFTLDAMVDRIAREYSSLLNLKGVSRNALDPVSSRNVPQ